MGSRLSNRIHRSARFLLDWDLTENTQFDERAALKIIRAGRRRNTKVPIFLLADRTLVSELPLEVMKQVHEYIHLFGDTPAFIANRVDFAVVRYHDQLLPPYFRELKKYTDQGAYSWDAPGRMGGVAFLKHPVGMAFHDPRGQLAESGIPAAILDRLP
jgi:arginine decarboxylase